MTNRANILVTGAAGFVGSNLAIALQEQGHRVVGIDNFLSGHRENLKDFRGKFVEHDVTENPAVLDRLAEGKWEYVFHDGDLTDPRYPDDEEILRRNLTGFRNLLELCQRHQARLIYASTAGLYGHGAVPMREDQPKDLITAYGRSKLMMDELGAKHYHDTEIVGLRYFNVFGPHEHHKGRAASMVYHLACQVKAGKAPRLFKWGEQKRDFVYVKDVVAANLCAMKAPSGVYNVGTGLASTFNDVAEAVKRAVGVKVDTEYFDMPYAGKTYQGNTQADTRLAEKKLGFRAQWGLQRAVDDYFAWMRENL